MVDWTSPKQEPKQFETPWVVHYDGAWCRKGAGVAVVVTSPTGVRIKYAVRLDFPPTVKSANNTTEYEGLLLALRKMKAIGQQTFIIRTDSKVICDHIKKDSEAKEPELIKYLEAVQAMEKHFRGFDAKSIRGHKMTTRTSLQKQQQKASQSHPTHSTKS